MAQNKKKKRPANRSQAPKNSVSAAPARDTAPAPRKEETRKTIVRVGMIVLALIMALSAIIPLFL